MVATIECTLVSPHRQIQKASPLHPGLCTRPGNLGLCPCPEIIKAPYALGRVATGGRDGKWNSSGIRNEEGEEEMISNSSFLILKPERGREKEEPHHSFAVVVNP